MNLEDLKDKNKSQKKEKNQSEKNLALKYNLLKLEEMNQINQVQVKNQNNMLKYLDL